MSATLLAGISCDGADGHAKRHWLISEDRRLHISDTSSDATVRPEVRFALTLPISGAAMPVACDAASRVVLLADAAAFHLDAMRHLWRPLTAFQSAFEREGYMKVKDAGPLLVAGWSLCGRGFAVVDRERRLWQWSPEGRASLAGSPVPGEQRIAAIDVPGRTVLFDTGERLVWTPGGWGRLPGVTDAGEAGTISVRCISGLCLGAGRDLTPGEIVELPEGRARELLARGKVELLPLDEHSAA